MKIETVEGRGDVRVGEELMQSDVQFTVQTNEHGQVRVETGPLRSLNPAIMGARATMEIQPLRYIVGTVFGVNFAGASRVGDRLVANKSHFDVKINWTEILTTR